MRYEIIMEKDNYALLASGNNLGAYAVVQGLDKGTETWNWTVGYWDFDQFGMSQSEALSKAINCYRTKTESNYISRCRLEELATLFKDGLIYDDKESACEYFQNTCEMTENELEFFGIEIEEV